MKPLNLSLFLLATALSLPSQGNTADIAEQYLSKLPATLELKETGPRQYVFTCDYFYLDTSGNLTKKERVQAEYTRGLPGNRARWDHAEIAQAMGFDAPFPKGEPQTYMDGFSYPLSRSKDALKEGFFAKFPDDTRTKTLVWDVQMFESFAENYFDKLQLNQPYRLPLENIPLAGKGTFQNRQVELTWLGVSKMNEKVCALIQYQALFNKVDLLSNGLSLKGRSHYWGMIWVSLDDKQIEYGTLSEDVLLEFDLPGQPGKQFANPVRQATLQRKR